MRAAPQAGSAQESWVPSSEGSGSLRSGPVGGAEEEARGG